MARGLADDAGLDAFTPVTDEFLPVGDQHGLLVLTDTERTLSPTTESTRIALTPVEVAVRGPREATVAPTARSVVVVSAGWRGPTRGIADAGRRWCRT